MKRNNAVFVYLAGDFVIALISWAALYLYRKATIEALSWNTIGEQIQQDINFWLGLLIVSFFWIFVYYLTGFYKDIYRKSRLAEVWQSFVVILLGTILLFFVLILDDFVTHYQNYYKSFLFLFTLHAASTITWRLVFTTYTKVQIKKGKVGFNTLIIGSNENAVELYNNIQKQEKSLGYYIKGFTEVNGEGANGLKEYVPKLGELNNLRQCIKKYDIEEVIIAIESSEHDKISDILNILSDTNVIIKIIPDIYDIIIGSVRVNNVFGAPLIEIYPDLMYTWQRAIKRAMDTTIALLVMIFLSPLYLYLAIRVKLSSPGPIFYQQKRIGRHGKSFYIYKFRSMYQDAEKDGPQLSSKNDQRVTNWGAVMRKWRLDELPQFYNVLKGDMSIVGPRPERPYYAKKIIKRAPHYKHLQKVKPGITSLGMVKFGYASTVSDMIERMKYDILYLENMSLALDLKVILYTLVTIVQGEGR